MSKAEFDGGGFPMFRSYHDVRLPSYLIGPHVSDHRQGRYTFDDFLKTIKNVPGWRRRFNGL